MVKFKFKNYETDMPNWAKHHETVGLHVRRVYENGDIKKTGNEELNLLVDSNEDVLKAKPVDLYNHISKKRVTATDYYLPLTNAEYIEPINYFATGASNTEQKMSIRYKFLMEDSLFILSHSLNTIGNYPLSAAIDGLDFFEEIIEEGEAIENIGIAKTEEFDNQYEIIVVDEFGCASQIEIEIDDLKDHLVAIEIYEYEMTLK